MKKAFLILISPLLFYAICLSEENQKHLNLPSAISIALQNNKELKELKKNILISGAKKEETKAKKGLNLGMQGAYRLTNKEMLMQGVGYKNYLPVSVTAPGAPIVFDPLSAQYHLPADPEIFQTKMSEKKQKNLGLSATLPVYTFGKLEGAIKIAGLSQGVDILNLKKTKTKVVYETKKSYYNCLLSDEFLKVAKETLTQAQKHLEVAEKKHGLGLVAKFDVIRMEVEVASAQENVIKAEKVSALAQMNLNNILGLPLEHSFILEKEETKPPREYDFYLCLTTALKERPEIGLLDIAEKQTEISARISRLLPYVGGKGEYSILSSGSTYTQEKTWTGTLFVDFPLFDSGEAKAKIKQAKETEYKIKISKEILQDGIKLQINEAILSLKEAKERIITSQSILKQAEEALKIADTGYREGVSTYLELTDARAALSRAKLNYIQATYDWKINEAKLVGAMGVMSDER